MEFLKCIVGKCERSRLQTSYKRNSDSSKDSQSIVRIIKKKKVDDNYN